MEYMYENIVFNKLKIKSTVYNEKNKNNNDKEHH